MTATFSARSRLPQLLVRLRPRPGWTRYALRVLLLAAVAGAIAAFFALGGEHALSLERLVRDVAPLTALVARHPVESFAAYFALYVAAAGLSLPGAAVLTVGAGALFGLWPGLLLASFASTIGATLAFLLARFLFRDWVRRWAADRFPERARRLEEGLARDGPFYLVSLRLVPAFPFWLVNILAGLTPIGTRQFYVASQIGMLPATTIFVNAGATLAALGAGGTVLTPRLILAFVLLACLPLAGPVLRDTAARRRLAARWPKPKRFDANVVVIGAGAAGLVAAYVANALRAKVVLVEGGRMGGDCLNSGCVPSKALLHAARTAGDFAAARARVRQAIDSVAPHDSVERYAAMGVDVRRGHAVIETPWRVAVDGVPVTTRAIVVAAGAAPVVPPIPGLAEAPFVTSETLWDIKRLPERMVVLGGGPIGCELAQGFARLGASVDLVEMADRLLVREDEDVSAMVSAALAGDGVRLHLGARAERIERDGEAYVLQTGDGTRIPFDLALVAVGRRPRVDGYGLEAIGVDLDPNGTIASDPFLRTNIPTIHVCGDVAGPFQLTHAGGYQGGVAALNALFGGAKRFRPDYRAVPSVVFTEPEVARVGLSKAEARARKIDVEATRYDLAELDRAIIDDATDGFVRVLTRRGRDRIVGAVIVGHEAGEMLASFTLAIRHGLGMKALMETIYPYPTRGEAVRAVAGRWRQDHASARGLAMLERWHRFRCG